MQGGTANSPLSHGGQVLFDFRESLGQPAGGPCAFYEVINQGGTAVNPPLVELCRSIRGFSDGEKEEPK